MFWRNILSPSKGFPEDGDSMFLRNVGTYVQAVVVLGGLVIIVRSFGLKVRGYKPGRQCIFKDVKISSMTSLGGEAKPSTTCRKSLQHVKDPF
jgi:hypothetical protein